MWEVEKCGVWMGMNPMGKEKTMGKGWELG